MTKTVTVIKGRTVTIKDAKRYLTIRGNQFGDCDRCGCRMNLRKTVETKEETLVCTNQFCKREVLLRHPVFFGE